MIEPGWEAPDTRGDPRHSRPAARDHEPGGLLFSAAAPRPGGSHSICPHCWMVNPGPFRLCSRCGADMRTLLQESGGLRRTAAAQSPMPMIGPGRIGPVARAFACAFVVLTLLSYVAYLLPPATDPQDVAPASPAGQGR